MSLDPLADVWLPVLASVGAAAASGAAWLALLRYGTSAGPEWMGLSFAAGTAWLGVGAALLAWTGPVATPAVLLLWLAVPALAAAGLRRPLLAAGAAEGWAGFLPAVALVLLSLWLAALRPVWNVDAQTRWVLHGQWLAQFATVTPDLVRDPWWTATHPTYPPLVPALVGLDLGLGASLEFGIRPLFPFFCLGLLGILHGALRRRTGPVVAAWGTAAFGLTPCFLYIDRSISGGGTGGDAALADVPLALQATALAVLLLRMLCPVCDPRRLRAAGFLAAFFAVGCGLTKQEGVPQALATLLAAALFLALSPALRPRLRRLAPALLALILAVTAWKLRTHGFPVEQGEDYLSLGSAGAFLAGLDRLPLVLGRFGEDLVALEVWGPLWLLLPLWLFLGGARRRRLAPGAARSLALLFTWIALDFGILVAAYVISGWKEGRFVGLMNVTLSRLVMHHAPLVALVAAEALSSGARPAPAVFPCRRGAGMQATAP